MSIELKDGAFFKGETQIATYDAETDSVKTEKRIAPAYRSQIISVLGHEPKFVSGAPTDKAPKVKENSDDPEPLKTPEAGDKTPAYIAWYRRNHTEAEFEEKYGNRKIGL